MRSLRDPLVRQALAMALAVGAVGIAFGAFASDGGLSLAKALALSALVYGGSAQIAAVGVAAEGGTGGASVAAGLLLSARNLAFGVALAPLLPRALGRRLAASQLVIDQSAAAALAQPRPDRAWRAFWLTGVWVLVLWLAGTAAGWALTGAVDVEALGIDAAIPALFLALLADRLRRPAEAATALAGGAIALALVPVAPAGVPILAASAGIAAGLALEGRRARP
jgi:predicted branched-subunit amino acid permease